MFVNSLRRLGFLAAMHLMWACGLRLASSDFIPFSCTNLHTSGPAAELACGEWLRTVLDSNKRRFFPYGFIALRLNHWVTELINFTRTLSSDTQIPTARCALCIMLNQDHELYLIILIDIKVNQCKLYTLCYNRLRRSKTFVG